MGSLYSLSPVYMNYRNRARKPACQQIHEALSMVKGGGCDLCVCTCVCMLIYAWVHCLSEAYMLSTVGVSVRTLLMMQGTTCTCCCVCMVTHLCSWEFVCGGAACSTGTSFDTVHVQMKSWCLMQLITDNDSGTREIDRSRYGGWGEFSWELKEKGEEL